MDAARPETDEPGTGESVGVDVRSFLLGLRQYWPMVVLGLVVGALVGMLASAWVGPRHVATETVRVTARPDPGEEPVSDPEVLAAELDQLSYEVRSPALQQEVSGRLGDRPIELTSGRAEESTLVTVEATAATPELAAKAAGLAVDLVVERRRAAAIDQADATASRLRERSDELAAMAAEVSGQVPAAGPDQPDAAARAARLQRRVEILLDQQADYERRATDVEIAGQSVPIGLERVDAGPATSAPAAPTRTDLVLLLGAVGTLVALAWLWLVEQRAGPRVTTQWLKRRVRAQVAAAESPVQLEVLALSLVDRAEGLAPALGYLQVGTSHVDLEPGAIVLARAVADVDRDMTVVDGDLRTPRETRGRPGLASYLEGRVEPDDLVAADDRGTADTDAGVGVRVLEADTQGLTSPLRAARSTRLQRLFEALAATSSVMVVVPDPTDRPEALLLLADTVGVVLELKPDGLRRRRVVEVVRGLESRGLPVLGVVTTMQPRRTGGTSPMAASTSTAASTPTAASSVRSAGQPRSIRRVRPIVRAVGDPEGWDPRGEAPSRAP